jgi:transposase InsO family protein
VVRGEGSFCYNIKHGTKIFRQNIICRFGVASGITVDNDKHFDSQQFREFCASVGTMVNFASRYHPLSNGVVERENGKISQLSRNGYMMTRRVNAPTNCSKSYGT